jgi:ParB-like chromosome segregation protein Spo0J
MIDPANLRRWAENIITNGLALPIWKDRDGLIIDGRNRWVACRMAGIEPAVKIYDGDEVLRQIQALNNDRRR